MKIYSVIVSFSLLFACSNNTNWEYDKDITIKGVHPVGITFVKEALWLSDTDNNRLVKLDDLGNIVQVIDSLDRPMHIDSKNNSIYIPEYGVDVIKKWSKKQLIKVNTDKKLDAPAGVSVYNNEIAVADFYNNRIHYFNGKQWITFGEKGKHLGALNYPTDVQITKEFIWVADAYNHRVQIFDKMGKPIKSIGESEEMNATTGIFVTKEKLFATDFENNRVLVFNHDGVLIQELTHAINKPTDIIVKNNKLFVLNYRTETIAVFKK